MNLKLGSKSELVKAWQKFVGVTPDGDFGLATEKATKFWQAENGLRADGIVGANTIAAAIKKGFQQAENFAPTSAILGNMKYSDAELIERVENFADGFDGWERGVYDIWLRAPRSPKNVDIFLDKVYTFNVAEKGATPECRLICTGTSLTGSWALQNFRQYNPFGAAILKSNQFVRDSHFYDFHKGYRAYRQGKPFPFYRDGDGDFIPEEIGTLYTKEIISANSHRANEKAVSTRNYNWSAACLVRNSPNQFKAWLAYMNARPLSVAILKQF